MFGRKQVAVLTAEFLGTGVLALVMLSVQHSTIGLPYFIALAGGLTVAGLVSVLNNNGANHFNPAVTIGMWTVRQISTLRALAYLVAQLLGAWAVYHLYAYFVNSTLQPIGGSYDGRVLVAEAVGGLVLVMAYAAAAFNGYNNSKKAWTVGAAYALAILVSASVAVGIVNPAVAIAERAFDLFGSMGWGTYALGPVLGAIIGANLFALLFAEENAFGRVREVVAERFSRGRSTATAAAMATEEAVVVPAAAASSRPARGAKAKSKAKATRKTKSSRTRK